MSRYCYRVEVELRRTPLVHSLICGRPCQCFEFHDDVIKWKHFPRNWPFVREIHRSPVNFPHKGQWRGALMFSLNYAWINDWVNNREAGDLRRQHGHYDVIVMFASHVLINFGLYVADFGQSGEFHGGISCNLYVCCEWLYMAASCRDTGCLIS